MEDAKKKIGMEILSMAADYCPKLLPIVHCLNFPSTVSDAIFSEKLQRLMNKQSADLPGWLKMAWNFEKDKETYASNVRKLIYLLNAMNEDKQIDVYANLLHAYQLDLLSYDDFFRLSWTLTQVYYDDLELLIHLYSHKVDKTERRLKALEPYGLLAMKSQYSFSSGAEIQYSVNELGMKMIACGLDFDNYDKYKQQ